MKNKIFWLGLVFICSFFTLFKLGAIPKAFYFDEAAFGYYGQSLLKYGTDEFGVHLPFYFKSIGDYKYPLYSYLTVIPVALFGPGELSARLVAGLSGIIIILFTFALADSFDWLPKSNLTRLVLALLVVSSPWYLLFARTARESTLGLALIVSAIYLLHRQLANTSQKLNLFPLSFLLLFLSGLAYSPYRIIVPLLLVGFFFFNLRSGRKNNWLFLFLSSLIILIFFFLTVDKGSRLRAENVLNTIDDKTRLSSIQFSNEVGQGFNNKAGWFLARFYDNKYALKLREYLNGYLVHYDLSYLFTTGNLNFKWYNVPGLGLLPFLAAPLILIGLYYLSRQLASKSNSFLIWWLVISALPAAITIEIPNPIRHFASFPIYVLFMIVGLRKIEDKLNSKRFLIFLLNLVLLFSAIFGFKQFFINREYHDLSYTNQGFKDMVSYLGENQAKYTSIELEGDPYPFFLLWGEKYGWTPDKIKTLDRQWGSVASLGKLNFLHDDCPTQGNPGKLYVCPGEVHLENIKIEHLSLFNDGKTSYTAFEFVSVPQNKK